MKQQRILSVLLVLLLLLGTIPVAAKGGEDEPFLDLEHDWSYDAIVWCAENGIMDGIGDGLFAPKATVTRAMFLTVLARMAKKLGYNLNGY